MSMKKILISFLLLSSTPCLADSLHTFDEVKAAILNGKTIHIIVNDVGSSGGTGAYTPNEMRVTDHSIASSFLHFTLNNPMSPNKPVYEFVRYTIADDNRVTIDSQLLAVPTYEPLNQHFSTTQKIDKGVTIFS